ncbi:hypothetical protein CLAFUW4_13513 [Fulvia fulva]|uniref:Apple domain-containing protein n=1 Tax=Passalora fulva TaxID=5499 RepID=A0A9Q8PKP2_PASFU|nr:uncharacterized protein CLAFUR5_13364 [Fulvia fulva]KAK4610069.1 hypothetical protein CLAFUR4_13515 [Fulvia fulva]KAK4611371.1 hypothetical protein CLAFUR0_13524 [Fulvia fulva]UJO24291.1 hypothetical protein CLAFUR5_13364 [Fulvia fulva]WPV22045.1 hypothetical protein CLAFUW4_13513 [Fulvia fulva]WPV36866.1 hypothetical protein CLAFUW7_13520 [Fulvia fulva]
MANVAVFESCTARCSSTTTCVALNYFRRTSTCTLLKDKSGISSANDDTDSAQLNTGGSFASLPLDASGAYNPPNSEFAFQVATNMVFGYSPSDLTRSVATTNFADCINQCATTDRCVMVKPKWLLEISPNYYDFDSTALRRVKYRHHTEDGAEDAAAVGS